eukprot:CAMPEP_0204917452 /NCGR_PEP_ID=MMETSP1397-20131031/15048_1 /ASSEMBLY_ACC=CAM_ASM_000891 /TAXON_ID=49980 /ORGANISM="Climacostomum Climacostomum virens, Strain Stock W-24" /LENGTH=519 /DNA_ID=CAMNT_0052090285 /DNA_START=437 /DNA_END=1996 /DNA_ORIENTATION=-
MNPWANASFNFDFLAHDLVPDLLADLMTELQEFNGAASDTTTAETRPNLGASEIEFTALDLAPDLVESLERHILNLRISEGNASLSLDLASFQTLDFNLSANFLCPDLSQSLQSIARKWEVPIQAPLFPVTLSDPSSLHICPFCHKCETEPAELRLHLNSKIYRPPFKLSHPPPAYPISVRAYSETSYIDALYEALCMKPAYQNRLEAFRDDLVMRIQAFFAEVVCVGEVQVKHCGSYEYGAASHGSDIDLSVHLDEATTLSKEGWELVERELGPIVAKQVFDEWHLRWAQRHFEQFPYELEFIPGRVKCLKVYLREDSKLNADIMINNILSERNTGLIKEYCRVGSTVFCQLLMLVKHWSKVKKLNGPKSNMLSSYAYVILVIAFLQTTENFPCLLENAPVEMYKNCNVGYNKRVEQWSSPKAVLELLTSFFTFYTSLDWEKYCVTIRQRAPIEKSMVNLTALTGKRKYIILDPFEESRNLTDVVIKGMGKVIEGFKEAARVLSQPYSQSSLDRLFSK